MPTVLITGANRGIGLEFCRQYLADNWQVLACCRSPEQALELRELVKAHPHLQLHGLDVTDYTAVRRLAKNLEGVAIDLLLCNAGVYGPKGVNLDQVDEQAWSQVLETNTIAPLKLAQAFYPHVAASEQRKMAFVSSKMGSMGDNTSGGSYIYRSSKAALNAVVKSLAIDMAEHGIHVVTLHPGWVRTAMGGPNALIETTESVNGLRRVVAALGASNSGHFLNYDGSAIPW